MAADRRVGGAGGRRGAGARHAGAGDDGLDGADRHRPRVAGRRAGGALRPLGRLRRLVRGPRAQPGAPQRRPGVLGPRLRRGGVVPRPAHALPAHVGPAGHLVAGRRAVVVRPAARLPALRRDDGSGAVGAEPAGRAPALADGPGSRGRGGTRGGGHRGRPAKRPGTDAHVRRAAGRHRRSAGLAGRANHRRGRRRGDSRPWPSAPATALGRAWCAARCLDFCSGWCCG